MAKSKVAPTRPVTLPRLELCAATILTRLAKHARSITGLTTASITLWSDSETTLAWIRGHPSRWKTYVANRVAFIQETLPDAKWRHLPGAENPADCASRGITPEELLNHDLWWHGPPWLRDDAPKPTVEMEDEPEHIPEQRARVHATISQPMDTDMLLRFSSLHRLLRVSAWCLRWLRVIRPRLPTSVSDTPLSREERERAKLAWIRETQRIWFAAELKAIESNQPVPSHSPLKKLNPFRDTQGVLRVGGRLKHSVLCFDQRHPAILPKASHLTALIIDACHRRTLHGGVQLTLSLLRQQFWVPGGRASVKTCIHRCTTCARWRAATPQPLMANLPAARVTASRPFTHVGVDYAGPILIRTSKGRGQKAHKAFLAIFVCLSTKAVHLEIVSDYTTDAFLAAFRRLVSRRGLCSILYSDRGTNFVGADAQLRALFKAATGDNRINDALASEGIEWRFNPPAAPHFGGLWEAAVKSVKHHLRRVIGESTLTYEEMATLLAQVEATLNSRPLQALSDDPEDLSALTPGHFLIGGALNAIPEPSLEGAPPASLSRWQALQQMRDHFWLRWSQEYLHTLTTRPKWWKKQTNLSIGDLCLIRSELTPPGRWPLARITATHPGADGQIRVVTVKTATSSLTRPVTKLVPLPGVNDQGKDQNPENITHDGNSQLSSVVD